MNRYHLASLLFRIAYRLDGCTYWFPRRLQFDPVHYPTRDEIQKATAPVYSRATLTFWHGFFIRRQVTLSVFKLPAIFMPTYWRWQANGDLTPGFIVEELEARWHLRREAMNVRLTAPQP